LIRRFLALALIAAPFALAQTAQLTPASTPTFANPSPNYDLASRWMPSKAGKLVFDTSVTPHWFENSDRFWYSFETSDGTRWWVVDPAKRTRVPLWENTKLAIALNTLTNFPYDSQHLPLRNVKLVKQDTAIRFDIEVSKDGVIPEEKPEEKQDKKVDEQTQDEENTQNDQDGTQQRGRGQSRQSDQTGDNATKPETKDTRTIYFEYELSTGKVTRLDNFQDRRRPMWAAISPDENTIIFTRNHNLYMIDAANYAKAQKNPADASIVETQLTTDGEAKYSYARQLITEDAEQLKRENKKDAENKAGQR